MSGRPDVNDTLHEEGGEGVRRRLSSARRFEGDPPPQENGGDERKTPPITATTWEWREPENIERRKWLHGSHYIRGSVTATIGKRGGGKSNRAIIETLSMITKRDLLETGSMPDREQRVWYIGEDTRDEIERRIVAACLHDKITKMEIDDRLVFNSIYEFAPGALKLATLQGARVVPNLAAITALKANIAAKKIDVLVLDPLKKFHGVRENDQEMDEVMTLLFEIAKDADVAIEFLHHSRKQQGGATAGPITADDARGADAIIAGPRDVRLVNPMSSKEAAAFGIPPGEAWRYSRIDDGKMNLKPPGAAVWAYSASVLLPCGDSVGVLQPWKPPQTFEGITKADSVVAQQLAQGGAFRADTRAKNWFGHALAERLGLNPRHDEAHRAKLKGMIETWLQTKVLVEKFGHDAQRKERTFIWPGPTDLMWSEVHDDMQLVD